MGVEFHDYSMKVKAAMNDRINAVLEECAGEVESQTKRNTSVGRVNGGKTKNDWQHKVIESDHIAYIGNNQQTAIWLEFGTGEHAIPNPDGKGSRKGGWFIPIGNGEGMMSKAVAKAYGFRIYKGKNGMQFAHTDGMKPQRPFWKAYTGLKSAITKRIQNSLKGL